MTRISHTAVVTPWELSPEERQRLVDDLHRVYVQIFDGVSREAFVRCVVESRARDTDILLQKNAAGELVGFCAVHMFETRLHGKPITVLQVESGALRAYRGGASSARFILSKVVRYRTAHPRRAIYFLDFMVHPSSYMALAKFVPVWPNPDGPVPPEIRALVEQLSVEFHHPQVRPEEPMVRNVGWRTRDTEAERAYWRQCDKRYARFFLDLNPGYGDGHGVLTVVQGSLPVLLQVAGRFMRDRIRQALDGALARIQRLPLYTGLLNPERRICNLLSAVPLFAGLSKEALLAISRPAEVMSLSAGAVVFEEGEASTDLYVIARGAVYVLAQAHGDEVVIDQLGPGDIFGEIAMLSGARRTSTIRTATGSTLLRIERAGLVRLMESNATIGDSIWRKFGERILDNHLRSSRHFRHLTPRERQAYVRAGHQQELELGEVLSASGPTVALVLRGDVELVRDDIRLTVRAPNLLEFDAPARLEATSPARLLSLPRQGAVREAAGAASSQAGT